MSDQPTSEIRVAKGEDKPPRNAREKRARLALIALSAGFGILMIIQGPTLLSAINGGGGDDTVAQDTASAEAAPEDGSAEAPPVDASAAGEVTPPNALRDSDLPQRAKIHELARVNNFRQSEPFKPRVTPPDTSATDGGSGSVATEGGATNVQSPATDQPSGDSERTSTDSGTSGSATSPSSGEATSETPTTNTGTENSGETDFSGAQLSINDISQQVSVGAKFPTSDPVFVVNPVKANVIEIGLVEGAFSTGTQSISIELGETRTLVSQPDGVRYSVRFDQPVGK